MSIKYVKSSMTKKTTLSSTERMEKIIETKQKFDKLITADTIILFDMDGTLVDTNLANFLSYKNAIQIVTGLETDLSYNPDQRFNRSVLKKSIPNLFEVEYDKIIQEKERVYNNFLPETKLIKRVVDILLKYSKTNKTILVTNCRKNRALMTLNYFGITDKFSEIFYRQLNKNENKVNKYQNAINCLNISTKNIIVFENEKLEIIDAIAAGIPIQNIINI